MYSAPGAATASSSASKSSIAIIGSVLCGGLLLFLLAATIVLALIPLYVPKKTATLDANSGKTSEFDVPISTGSGTRKRQSGTESTADASKLANYPGATVDTNTKSSIKGAFDKIAKKHKCFTSVVIVSVTVQVTSRKRRFSLAKRQSSAPFFNVRTYAVVNTGRCSSISTITTACSSLADLFVSDISSGAISLTNVIVMSTSGQILITITTVRILRCIGRPSITPGRGGGSGSGGSGINTKPPTGFPSGNVG